MPYIGRFAPSPTGPLHAGSLVAALASWLDARAHGGRWLVRIDDVDSVRCVAGADREILRQLAALGLLPDAPPLRQSIRSAAYRSAIARLQAQGSVYPCGCSRSRIAAHWQARGASKARGQEWPYPGTCRNGAHGRTRSLRVLAPAGVVEWVDRRLGVQRQNVAEAVGDFIVQRADGVAAYQLAVVVDDADQGVTHVVRGEDLADNTPRQLHLQSLLGLDAPTYLHTPLVVDDHGEKLSKQQGAPALSTADPLAALRAAGSRLELHHSAASVAEWLAQAVRAWPDACALMCRQARTPEVDRIAAFERGPPP